ncbi:alpha/beta-hydrolase [Daedaleopsis nitida]|nr:alpha/beta-hydrolase [Daedaleopsis nitida]
MGPPVTWTRRQPFKSLYIVYLLTSVTFVRLPWWCVWYLPRSHRPRPSWPLKRCIIVTAYREILTKLALQLGIDASRPPPKSDDELKNAKFVWIDGLTEDSEVFCGELRRAADINNVHPTKVAAYWMFKSGTSVPTDLKAKEGELVALHIHGGAFYLGSAHPEAPTSNLSRGILNHSHIIDRVLGVDYRLSAAKPDTPKNPFPAAVLDSLAAYQYLVKDLGFDPGNIVVAGDSAGGNLAFSLVRHLVENAIPGLAPPGRLLSCSAWLDLSETHKGPESSLVRNRKHDILGMGAAYPLAAYLGSLDPAEGRTNRYISPVSPVFDETQGMFKGFPRTYISAGGMELILDDSTLAAEKLKADGVEVEVEVFPDAIHDFTNFPWHEPERSEGLKKIGRWLDG